MNNTTIKCNCIKNFSANKTLIAFYFHICENVISRGLTNYRDKNPTIKKNVYSNKN